MKLFKATMVVGVLASSISWGIDVPCPARGYEAQFTGPDATQWVLPRRTNGWVGNTQQYPYGINGAYAVAAYPVQNGKLVCGPVQDYNPLAVNTEVDSYGRYLAAGNATGQPASFKAFIQTGAGKTEYERCYTENNVGLGQVVCVPKTQDIPIKIVNCPRTPMQMNFRDTSGQWSSQSVTLDPVPYNEHAPVIVEKLNLFEISCLYKNAGGALPSVFGVSKPVPVNEPNCEPYSKFEYNSFANFWFYKAGYTCSANAPEQQSQQQGDPAGGSPSTTAPSPIRVLR